MTNLIKTEKSFLDVHVLKDINILTKCVNEIDGKLEKNPKITVYGNSAIQHRCIGFFSDKSVGYKYSGQLMKSQQLTNDLTILLNQVNKFFKTDFNGILVNKYSDGNDYIGAHSDDEKCLSDVGVVSISYGCTRKFRIRDKNSKKIIGDIPTKPNEMIHMGGNFQQEFTHEIPIEKTIMLPRWSFTFRKHNE